jgi:hypothetical protein
MNTDSPLRWKHALAAFVTTVVLAACADVSPLSPDRSLDIGAGPGVNGASMAGPELGACDRLQAPAGTTFAFRAYARGVQTYRWNGNAWAPAGPRADLFADAGENARVGTHYVGPYWESLNGSKVKGAVIDKCTVDADAIDWLSLSATPEGAPGIFARVVFIQRVNTVGGKAPVAGGVLNELREVPYSADYYFYRGR